MSDELPPMDVTINFHCTSCGRDGFCKILGGQPPEKLICPACGAELAEVQCGYSDPTLYMSRVGDPADWDYSDAAKSFFERMEDYTKKGLACPLKSTPPDGENPFGRLLIHDEFTEFPKGPTDETT